MPPPPPPAGGGALVSFVAEWDHAHTQYGNANNLHIITWTFPQALQGKGNMLSWESSASFTGFPGTIKKGICSN